VQLGFALATAITSLSNPQQDTQTTKQAHRGPTSLPRSAKMKRHPKLFKLLIRLGFGLRKQVPCHFCNNALLPAVQITARKYWFDGYFGGNL
jgi:hypothetical protein